MNYFCAQCQKRHPIHDIAADLREISRDEIIERVDSIFSIDSDKGNYIARLSLSNNLKRFVNDESLSGSFFLFKSNQISSFLQDAKRVGMVISGRLYLTLEWLIEKYKESGAYSEDRENGLEFDLNELSQSEKAMPVFDKKIKFYFKEIEKDEVFDWMEDESGDPFSDENSVMRGYWRACPHCGYRVPRAVGRAEEIVVALAGSPRSGKSSCLVSIASALAANRYADFGLSMENLNDDFMWEELKKEIEWFDKGYAVTKTPPDLKAVPSYSLLVKCFNRKRVLTFVDMPGEFWQTDHGLSPEFFKKYAGIYCNIDCIWFFVSKMTAYSIDLGDGKEAWQQDLILKSSEKGDIIKKSNASNLSANLSSLKERLSAYGLEIPPIAVIISKAEMEISKDDIKNAEDFGLFPAKSNALLTEDIVAVNLQEIGRLIKPKAGRQKEKIFNELEYFFMANQIREFFRTVNPGFCNAVEENCPFRTYISMSAYGHPAATRSRQERSFGIDASNEGENVKPLPPAPYHEMMPLIWSLAIMGAIEIEHRCIWRWSNFIHQQQSVEGIVNLDEFRYTQLKNKQASAKQKPAEEDRMLANQAVANNLLMRHAGKEELLFSRTVFLHKR